MHGYELRKQLSQKLGLFWTVSFGSLYPTLKKLERRGVVEKVAPGDEERSRRKQEYRITAAGEDDFLALLGQSDDGACEEEKFPLRLAFFQYLSPETRLRLLERRRVYLEDRLAQGERALQRALRLRADTYTVALMRHGVNGLHSDIAWLDDLIATERLRLGDDRPDPPDRMAQPYAGDTPDTATRLSGNHRTQS